MHKYDSLMFTRLLSNLLYVNLSIDQIPLILSKPWKMGGGGELFPCDFKKILPLSGYAHE